MIPAAVGIFKGAGFRPVLTKPLSYSNAAMPVVASYVTAPTVLPHIFTKAVVIILNRLRVAKYF